MEIAPLPVILLRLLMKLNTWGGSRSALRVIWLEGLFVDALGTAYPGAAVGARPKKWTGNAFGIGQANGSALKDGGS